MAELLAKNKSTGELRRILRRAQLPDYTGLQRSRINELIKLGRFPKPIMVGERTTAWFEDEVAAWQQQRAAERDAKKEAET
jgi:prophage regulatory protein